jgi:hypothetical protein
MREALTVWTALTSYHNAGHELTRVLMRPSSEPQAVVHRPSVFMRISVEVSHQRTSAIKVLSSSSQIRTDEGYEERDSSLTSGNGGEFRSN